MQLLDNNALILLTLHFFFSILIGEQQFVLDNEFRSSNFAQINKIIPCINQIYPFQTDILIIVVVLEFYLYNTNYR